MPTRSDSWQRLFYQVVLLSSAAALLMWLVMRLKVVSVPVLIGFFIAYALHPVVLWLRVRRVPGFVALTVPLTAAVGLLIVLFVVVLPGLGRELVQASQSVPGKARDILTEWSPWFQKTLGVSLDSLVEADALQRAVQDLFRELIGPARSLLGWVWNSAKDIAMTVGSLLLIVVVAAFLIDDYTRIVQNLTNLVPRSELPRVSRVVRRIDETLMGFLRGELLLLALATVWLTAGLLIVGVPFALVIGPFSALIYLVPYVGLIVGTLLSVLVAVLESPTWPEFFAVLTVFSSFYAVDILFITPRIIGNRVGLRPLVVLVGIVAGGELFGIVGVLLAIPSLAVGCILLLEIVDQYRASPAYLGRRSAEVVITPAAAPLAVGASDANEPPHSEQTHE